ncbi:hypothetical protein J6590_020811 [Homalodisca vitripennis]|nr:hypothetical protein J6590_020811 [Homalodisca vitripennis]
MFAEPLAIKTAAYSVCVELQVRGHTVHTLHYLHYHSTIRCAGGKNGGKMVTKQASDNNATIEHGNVLLMD